MARAGEVRVEGLRKLHRNLKNYDEDAKRGLEAQMVATGLIVQTSAVSKAAARYGIAASFQSRVRGFGRVSVGRTKRARAARRRGDFGALLLVRTLLPSLGENEVRVTAAVNEMLRQAGRRNGF